MKWCPEAGVCPHDSDTGKSNIMVFGPYEVDGSERIQANTKGLPRILHRKETYSVILVTMYKYLVVDSRIGYERGNAVGETRKGDT